MEQRKGFVKFLEEAKRDLFLLQQEACVLQATVQTRADTESELKRLKEQWSMKERILRTLATGNSAACRKKTKQFREKLQAYVKQKRKAARKRTVIPSCTCGGLSLEDVLKGVKCRRMAFNRWLSDVSPHRRQQALIVHKEVFKLLGEITVHVKDVRKISRNKEEIIGLKKAVDDTVSYLESNRSLVSHWFSTVTPAWDIMKLHFPQECSRIKNRDVPSTLNYLHTSNDGSKTQAGTSTVGTYVISGTSSQSIGINNNVIHKEKNSTNSNSKSLESLHTHCSECMCSIHKTNKAEQLRCTCPVLRDSRRYKPYARKGTQGPYVFKDNSVLKCSDQYVTSKRGKADHLNSSGTCEQDNGNQITRVSNAESALEDASNDSMSTDCDIAAIAEDVNVVSPVSSFNDSFCDNSDRIENIPSYELESSVVLEDGRTEVQEAADINSCNKDSAHFTPDATGSLTPSAAYENGPSVMCPRTKEIYNTDGILREHKSVYPISSLDDSRREMSDITQNFPSFGLDYSKTLEEAGTEIQKAADINDHNKDSTQFTSTATGTSTPSAAYENGPSVISPRTKEIYNIDGILREHKSVYPISSLDDSRCEMSDITENFPSFGLDYSKTLEDVGTEIQKAADVNDRNIDITQFTSTATGTLTPSAAYENGPYVMSPRAREEHKTDITQNFPSFGLDYSKTLEDVGTEIQKAADINDCNIDITQFISTATGTLTPSAAYMDVPSSMFLTRKENEKFYSKELKYIWHIEGQNLPEEHMDEDYAEFMTVHHSLQGACTPFTVPLPWTAQFS